MSFLFIPFHFLQSFLVIILDKSFKVTRTQESGTHLDQTRTYTYIIHKIEDAIYQQRPNPITIILICIGEALRFIFITTVQFIKLITLIVLTIITGVVEALKHCSNIYNIAALTIGLIVNLIIEFVTQTINQARRRARKVTRLSSSTYSEVYRTPQRYTSTFRPNLRSPTVTPNPFGTPPSYRIPVNNNNNNNNRTSRNTRRRRRGRNIYNFQI